MNLLSKREEMMVDKERLEKRLLDPNRLKARGSGAGRLMHEEKQRKRIQVELPELNTRIMSVIEVCPEALVVMTTRNMRG